MATLTTTLCDEIQAAPEAARPYEPFGAARRLCACRDAEVLIEGPAGTGKSRAVLEKVYLVANKYPDARILLVRKTRSSLTQSILVTWETKVVPERHPILVGPRRPWRESYRFHNGAEVVCGGLDHVERIMSSEYDLICLFEATEATESDWEHLLTRLRNHRLPYQQAIADCNPAHPQHWLNQRALKGKMTRLLSRHEDNPSVTGAYLARLGKLSGHRRDRLYLGKGVAAEGAVWPEYDAAVHLVEPFEIPADWQRYRAIDFGYTNPFVCQWWAEDGDGRLYLYRELYETRKTVEQHAETIKRLSAGEQIVATVADHDAEDRATLSAKGIETVPADKRVTTGIQAVAERLRPAGDGRPRLFIVRDALATRDGSLATAGLATSTAEEVEGYLWAKTPDGQTMKEQPDKRNCADHGCDAMRYLVMWRDQGYRPDVRVIDFGGGSDTDRMARFFGDD